MTSQTSNGFAFFVEPGVRCFDRRIVSDLEGLDVLYVESNGTGFVGDYWGDMVASGF